METNIHTVDIVSKPNIDRAGEILRGLLDWLEKHHIESRCDEQTAFYAGHKKFYSREDLPKDAQLIVVLGGDGTLLAAARVVGGREIPLLAVNLGGLGFLTAITLDQLYPELEQALTGEHRIGKRRMLDCELVRESQIIASFS